jgi:uncharacterized membrane protein
MKTSSVALLVLGLLGAVGCDRGTPGGPGAQAPTTSNEASKPAPTVANKPIIGEAENTFSLSVPFLSTTLKQGEEKTVVIGINRGRNFGEEVAIQVAGLPAGVTLESANPVIKHGSTEAPIVLKAADDAALGDFTVKVTGHTASSGADSSNELKITVAQK